MKKFFEKYSLYLLPAAMLLVGLFISFTTSAAPPAPSASGQGALPNIGTGDRHFAFNAKQGPNGTATGKAVLHNPAFDGADGHAYQAHIDILCMQKVGNTVLFGGFVRKTNDPNLVDAVFFTVQDNGEPGAGNDMISRAYFADDIPETEGDPMACLTTPIDYLPLEEIESGNIQVRP